MNNFITKLTLGINHFNSNQRPEAASSAIIKSLVHQQTEQHLAGFAADHKFIISATVSDNG